MASGEPLLEPKSLKIGAGAPPNRSGADSGNCGRGGDLRGNAETRHGPPNGKKIEKWGPKMTPFEGYAPPLFRSFFSASFPTLPRGGPGAPFGAIWVDVGIIFGCFLARFSSLLRGKILTEILQNSCTKPADTLGNPTRMHKL